MGMHREEVHSELHLMERSARKITWWTLHIFEKFLCILLGRPSCIDDAEVTTEFDNDSRLDDSLIALDYRIHGPELMKLSYQIMREAHPTTLTQTPSVELTNKLLRQLDEWYSTVPVQCRVDSSFPKGGERPSLLVHLVYLYTRCVITRGFVVQKVEEDILRFEDKPSSESAQLVAVAALREDCLNSALETLQHLSETTELGQLQDHLCLRIFHLFHAVLIICVDFLARPRHQKDSPKDIERKIAVRESLRSTRPEYLPPTCTSGFSYFNHCIQMSLFLFKTNEYLARHANAPKMRLLAELPCSLLALSVSLTNRNLCLKKMIEYHPLHPLPSLHPLHQILCFLILQNWLKIGKLFSLVLGIN